LVLACLVAVVPAPLGLSGQTTSPATPREPAPSADAEQAYGLRAVSSHVHGTAVAVALRLPAGSQDDREGLEGTAWLLAHVLEDQAARALEPSDAVLRAAPGRASTVFTLLALPDEWEAAWAKVDSVLFAAPLDSAYVAARKAEILDNLRFERGSPVRDFEREAAGMLGEPGSPFVRPPRGTEASVAKVTAGSLESYRRSFYRREAAAQAVVGPVEPTMFEEPAAPTDSAASADVAPDSVAPHPSLASPDSMRPDTSLAAPDSLRTDMSLAAPDSATGAGERAWSVGRRVAQVSDVTSAWVSVDYPAPRALPRTQLELVAHLLEEELDPTPPDPDRYDVDVRIVDAPGGPVLVVEATVFPEAAGRWEARILDALAQIRDNPMPEDFFSWRRRRFRTARLLEEAAPEKEAARMTADLLRTGRVRDLPMEIWSLDAATLQRAARVLGEPRIFILGPDLGQNGSGRSGR
jgi:hypothetical protein